MYDIVTFGSATRDIFLKLKNSDVVSEKKFYSGRGICFNLGAKIDVEDIYFSTGGGGTNAAATFASQGFKTAYCGKIGEDFAGKEILNDLKAFKIDARFVLTTSEKPSNYSVIFGRTGEDRTILVYRGASELIKEKEIPLKKLKAKWFYLAPLSGQARNVTFNIIDFAKKNNIKTALNPGNSQLNLPNDDLARILLNIDILILNQEEAALLEKKGIGDGYKGIKIVTKGPAGVDVFLGHDLYSAGILETKVADRTGAGDAFGSGFISGFLQTNGNIEFSTQLGMANSSSCVGTIGAKTGLLKKGDDFEKVKVVKSVVGENVFNK